MADAFPMILRSLRGQVTVRAWECTECGVQVEASDLDTVATPHLHPSIIPIWRSGILCPRCWIRDRAGVA